MIGSHAVLTGDKVMGAMSGSGDGFLSEHETGIRIIV
jgi:hypothetical protein